LACAITWDGGGDGINWSDPLNWSTDTLPTGSDNIIIDDDDFTFSQVHLDIDFTLTTGSFTIDSGDALFIDGTVLTNLSSNTVTNSGFIELGGTITNSGTFVNAGTLFGSELLGSQINNDGMFILSGGLGAEFGPIIVNTGTFVVEAAYIVV